MNDPVTHPSHYTDGKIETIDFINEKQLDFNLGNAVKYISRAGKKDPDKYIEDLEKAIFYLNDAIERREGVETIGFKMGGDDMKLLIGYYFLHKQYFVNDFFRLKDAQGVRHSFKRRRQSRSYISYCIMKGFMKGLK